MPYQWDCLDLRRPVSTFDWMHPIERLRHVARAGWAGPSVVAAEAAWALADLSVREPPALLPACRRLLERQPGCGPLWWVAARILSARDPVAEAESCAQALESDPTDEVLLDSLPTAGRVVRHGGISEVASAELVVVEADAVGPGQVVVDGSRLDLIQAARIAEVPIWIAGGVGRALPPRLWHALSNRLDSTSSRARPTVRTNFGYGGYGDYGNSVNPEFGPGTLVDYTGVELVYGPAGAVAVSAVTELASDCPEPAELLEDF